MLFDLTAKHVVYFGLDLNVINIYIYIYIYILNLVYIITYFIKVVTPYYLFLYLKLFLL